jgi:hypothetical protein
MQTMRPPVAIPVRCAMSPSLMTGTVMLPYRAM